MICRSSAPSFSCSLVHFGDSQTTASLPERENRPVFSFFENFFFQIFQIFFFSHARARTKIYVAFNAIITQHYKSRNSQMNDPSHLAPRGALGGGGHPGHKVLPSVDSRQIFCAATRTNRDETETASDTSQSGNAHRCGEWEWESGEGGGQMRRMRGSKWILIDAALRRPLFHYSQAAASFCPHPLNARQTIAIKRDWTDGVAVAE